MNLQRCTAAPLLDRMPKHSRLPKLGPMRLCLLLMLATTLSAAAKAEELRFTRLEFTEATASWRLEMAASNAKKAADKLTFWADGTELEADIEATDRHRLVIQLRNVPAGISRLSAGSIEKEGPQERVALQLGPSVSEHSGHTIYHVMMGYFRNGNPANDGEIESWRHANYAGGDLQGILDKVDYLADLGIDAVWLSPLFESRTSHGYDVVSYYRIGDAVGVPQDPDASLDLFRKVVAALKQRGIRVILDLPLNHASRSYDREHGDPGGLKPRATAARQEAEKLWESWGSAYRYWNFDHQPTRRFLKDAALYWLGKEGVAGLRLDYVRGVPYNFWAELYQEVKAVHPEAFLLGECWIDAGGPGANAEEIARYYAPVEGIGRQFDSLLDFPLQSVLTDVFARGGSAQELETWLQNTSAIYGPSALPTYFLDNHDMTRFLSWTADSRRLTAALSFLASLSSPMVMFYGTETGLANGSPKPGFVDTGRIPMAWERLNQPLIDEISTVLRARHDHPVLGHGGRLPLESDKDLLLMAKVLDGSVALVAVHLGEKERAIEVDLGTIPGAIPDADGLQFRDLEGKPGLVPGTDGTLVWILPPVSTSILLGKVTE